MEVTYTINFGGFVGADEEFTIEVPKDATQEEIEALVQEDYEYRLEENCSWDITDIARDEEEEED